jgi:hypothetical protein
MTGKFGHTLRLVGVVSLVLASSAILQAQTPVEQASVEPKSQTPDAAATKRYWDELKELNKTIDQEFTEIAKQIETPDGEAVDPVVGLLKASDTLAQIMSRHIKRLDRLKLKGVDDRVLEFVNADARLGIQTKEFASEAASRLDAIAKWRNKSNSIPDSLWNDLLYTFTKALEFQPSAGPERIMKEADALDEEGKQLVSQYLECIEKGNELLRQTEDEAVKELELRQYLTKKFGIEFPALNPDD